MMTYQRQQRILRTDIAGMPLEWIHYQTAAKLYCSDQVAYDCGHTLIEMHGGVSAINGQRSHLKINSIIATQGCKHNPYDSYTPPLNNPALFRRDDHICLYCGKQFSKPALSQDHVHPLVLGGEDIWSNAVTACKRCNCAKGGKTPEQANMQLLAIPFQPTYAEYIFLQGRHIFIDQMEFLSAHFPRSSPLRHRKPPR